MVEHFCTLFDSGYILQGMALHNSLMKHARAFHLWIVCMDRETGKTLDALRLPNLTVLNVQDMETPALLAVKPTRSKGEYCWTVTPFVITEILRRAPDAGRVTYLDADLMFFDNPQILLDDFSESGKSVLITEHAYAPEYDQSQTSGRFCVQFMTFTRSTAAEEIVSLWQGQCLDWCYARVEDGKFGDQKYLDPWPDLFPDVVHISPLVDRILGPWNVRHFARRGALKPVLYHFHGFKQVGHNRLRLYWGYKVGNPAKPLYDEYVLAIRAAIISLRSIGLQWCPSTSVSLGTLKDAVRHSLRGTAAFARI